MEDRCEKLGGVSSFAEVVRYRGSGRAYGFLYHNGKVRMHYDDDGVKIYEYVDDDIDGLI